MTKNSWAAIALGAALFAVPFAAFAADSAPTDASTGSDFETHVSWMESNWDAMNGLMESGDWEAMHALMQSAPGMTGMMGGMDSTGMMGGMDSMDGGDPGSHHTGTAGMGGMNW